MYTLTVRIDERVRMIQHESPDYLNDRVCTILCDSHDDYYFDNKIYDMRYRASGDYERYIETADIVNAVGETVGFYMIKKD